MKRWQKVLRELDPRSCQVVVAAAAANSWLLLLLLHYSSLGDSSSSFFAIFFFFSSRNLFLLFCDSKEDLGVCLLLRATSR
jgi:hypothetical protein